MPGPDDDAADVAEHLYVERNDEFSDASNPNSFPDGDTIRADRDDARAAHDADRPPTPDEERAAEQNELDDEVADRYEEAIERGARLKGEGEISP